MREGSLEAPTRHPLDWQSEAFYDEGKALAEPDRVSSDCPIAGRHVMQGMGEDKKQARKAHPLTLLRKAYGI